MINRIHIFGASGSGTTTLGKALADTMNWPHYDTDNYFWLKTDPPFQSIRKRAERQDLLHQILSQNDSWVLSGSLCGWGDFAIPIFDLVIFLWLPPDIRMHRLRKREIQRYGPDIKKSNHPRHNGYKEFLEWAAAYDTGGLDIRSKSSHEKWITTLPYQIIRIEGNRTILENMKTIVNEILLNKANELGCKFRFASRQRYHTKG